MTGADAPRDVLIVVPTLGRRIAYLRQALASIVTQAPPPDVVLVAPVDAAGARAVAADFTVSVVDDPGGLSAAVNAGLAAAGPHHRFAGWLGDDDLLAPGALAATAAVLRSDPGVSVAFGRCSYIDDDGRPIWLSRYGRWAPAVLSWGPNLIPQPGMLFRLADFRDVGGLDESLQYAMDLDLLLRLRRRGRLQDVGAEVSSFRWHAGSTTVGGREPSLAESERVKRRYLSRSALRLSRAWERPVRLATLAAARRMSRAGAAR